MVDQSLTIFYFDLRKKQNVIIRSCNIAVASNPNKKRTRMVDYICQVMRWKRYFAPLHDWCLHERFGLKTVKVLKDSLNGSTFLESWRLWIFDTEKTSLSSNFVSNLLVIMKMFGLVNMLPLASLICSDMQFSVFDINTIWVEGFCEQQ